MQLQMRRAVCLQLPYDSSLVLIIDVRCRLFVRDVCVVS